MLALFLGFTKRRQEAMLEQSTPVAPSPAAEASSRVTRPVLEHYSLPFLDQMIAMVTAGAIMSYAIYAVNSPFIGSKMLATAPVSERERIKANFYRVAGERLGLYALMDYVNFKGEGVSPAERYRGQGWGLLQVLETMPAAGLPLSGFAKAADQVLTRRVSNSPPARNEAKWLPGWRNRLETYLD